MFYNKESVYHYVYIRLEPLLPFIKTDIVDNKPWKLYNNINNEDYYY